MVCATAVLGPAPPAQAAEGLDWTTILDRVPFGSFDAVDAERGISFPSDHGAHPASPADVWNLAAHLETEDGVEVGFQLSVARVALAPPDEPPAEADWEIRGFWRGHATLVEGGVGSAIGEERVRRGFRGIAGYDDDQHELRLDNWSLRFAEGADEASIHIVASIGPAAAVTLDLVPEKPVITPDPAAGTPPFVGYAMSRLRADGTLATAEGERPVSGMAWFEHVWGDLPFPGGPTATDRLLLHLDDGSELSLTRTRRRDGAGTPSLDGFVVRPDGEVEQLPEETSLTPDGAWRREAGGAEYPLRWRLAHEGTEMDVTPVVDDQLHAFMAPVWNGMVVAEGTSPSGPVSAVGTLQLQGYGTQ